ncbi:uncharacterized protein WM294_010352 [Sarcoramphus papa]
MLAVLLTLCHIIANGSLLHITPFSCLLLLMWLNLCHSLILGASTHGDWRTSAIRIGEILRAREPQKQPRFWVPFAHGHPSFRRSKAPGAPSKTVVINSIMDEPLCESVMPSAGSRQAKWVGSASYHTGYVTHCKTRGAVD